MSRLLTCFAAIALVAGAASAQDAARMDAAIQRHVDRGVFTGSVLVASGNEIIFNKAYGPADRARNLPNTPATRYRIGSLTKQFTAASILLLAERGRLRLTDPIRVHLPDAPAAWEAITIEHLLAHTAGLPNFTALPQYPEIQKTRVTPAQLMATFSSLPLDFLPGTDWRYSNSGYAVLGALIERVSGEAYASFLQKNIFDPLGMPDSGYDSSTTVPGRALGYSARPGGIGDATFIDMTVPFAAGALYSTTADLLTWQRALFGGRLLSPASLETMLTPRLRNYGLGVEIRSVNGRRVITHGGSIDGFQSFLAYYPEAQLTVAILGNLNTPLLETIFLQLAEIAFQSSGPALR